MAAYQQQPPPGSGYGLQFLNSPFGDTTFTKVFVGGLAWETQSDTMRRYFEQFGEILEAVVITDKNTARSKGYGFVTFRDPESATRACADPTPVIDGRRSNCNLASLGRPRPALPFGRLRSPTTYLGGLPAARGASVGSFGYQQPVSYGYQQGLMYSSYGMQHIVQNMSILRVFTILMGGSSTFKYMVYLGLLIQLCFLTARWVRLFQGVIVIQHCRGMQCPVISLCSLGLPVSMLRLHHLFQQFSPHIQQVLQLLFHHSLSLYFLLILLSSCKVVVLTKMQGEGFIKLPLDCSRTKSSSTAT